MQISKKCHLTALLIATVAVAGCGSSDKPAKKTPPAKSAQQLFGQKTLELGQSVAELRGHYMAAKALYGEKDFKGAKVHTDHPVSELYSSFRQAVVERDPQLDKTVKSELNKTVKMIDQKVPAKTFNKQVDKVSNQLMDRVIQTAAPNVDPQNSTFKIAIAAGVVNTAANEYLAAVQKGKIKLLPEYQDSYGFVSYCKLVSQQEAENLGKDSQTVQSQIAKLESTIYTSGYQAPTNPKDPDAVRAQIDQLIESIQKGSGHQLLLPATNAEVELQQIADKLDQAVALYKAGKKTVAIDTVGKAYIDNFEDLEGPLAEKNPELMEELESLIGVKISDLMRANASLSEVKALVKQVKETLPEAEKALGGSGKGAY